MGVLTQYGSDIGGIDAELIAKIGTDTLQTEAQNLSGAVNELAAGGANSWRNIKVNGTQQLSNDTTSGPIDFVNGNNTTVTFNATGNTISITAEDEIIALTNEQYQALSTAEKNNGKYYYITDVNSTTTIDTNVTQVESTTNADYEILLSNNASTATETSGVKKSEGFKYNPSTGNMSISSSGLSLTHGSSDIVLSGTNNVWYGTKTSLKDAVSSLSSDLGTETLPDTTKTVKGNINAINSSLTQLYYSTNTNQLDSRSIDVSTTVTYNVTPTHNGWLSVQFTTTTGAVELFARIRQGVFGDFFQGTLPSYHVNETFLMIPCKANTAYSVEIKRTNTTSPLTIKVIEAY